MPDPWLSARMKEYTYIRRAEAQLYPAIRDAVAAFLEEARSGPLGGSLEALTAAADPEPGEPPGVPSEATWRRILDRFVLGPSRALWRGSFGRITGRDDTPDDDGGHGQGLGDRLAGFRRAFADRMLRAILQRHESPEQLRERLAALMTLEEWDGQVMTMTRTETMTALNAGAAHGALAEQERTGQPWEKRWQCTHDQRVRETHLSADGQVRPLAEPFEIGGHRLQFPGDPLGPAGEVINCRCSARYGPAGDPALTAASAPQEESMTTPTTTAPTDTGPVTVEPSGRWRGVLGFMDEWSADQRMLATPEQGVRARPLPLPLLVQGTLAKGHDGSELGVGVIDRIWTEGNAVWGEGRFDMEDPVGRDLARKVGLGFIRFVSLDVDDATAHQVLLKEDGTIVPDGDPNDRSLMVGDVYDGWRVMGATLLAHPAFPNAAIALADENGQALTASAFAEIVGYDPAWGCVKPDAEGAWVAADCEDPEAVPAGPDGQPFEPEQGQGEQPPVEPEEVAVATQDAPQDAEDDEDTEGDQPPADIAADDQQAAEELDPATEPGTCVAPTEDGGWAPSPCDAPGAVPANETGDGPAEQPGGAELGVQRLAEEDAASPEAQSGPTHAGLAVKAADTGRVLLLQRALDDEDPASGMWEWPGGGIEQGETPEDAAYREFAEETGVDVRGMGEIVDTWTSDNGVYQGFLLLVEEEATVGINPGADDRTVLNPDDPDGDQIEVVAWWDAATLPEMSHLREEVKATPWEKITGAGAPETEAAAAVTEEAEAIVRDAEQSAPPEGCEPCQAVAITAAADTFAPGWVPPGEWFQPPTGTGAHSIRVDVETGQVSGYLAAWGSCHVGYRDRCVPPPRSASGYAYYNLRPVRTSTGTVHCGLITMNTGHAKLTAAAASAMAHYDHTGTQAAVVHVGEDNHGIWVAGAVLPFLTKDDRLRLSLASFSGDWREVRGGAELIAALAVNSPGFPLAARKTGTDGRLFALTAAGFFPEEEETGVIPVDGDGVAVAASSVQTFELRQSEIHTGDFAAAVADELEGRAHRRARAASLEERMSAFRVQASQRRQAELARRAALAKSRIRGLQPQRKTEVPMPLAGFGGLPTPSNQDIALAKNWVDEQGGLPSYIKRIADHLKAKGMDTSRAIATGVNAAKKMCASGDLNWPGIQQVNPGSKAEACAAIEKWEAMKAAARAS